MPRFLKGRDYEDRKLPRRLQPFIPVYPMAARRGGVQGEVYVEFVVPAGGHPRLPKILYAIPAGYFEEAARDNVMRSTYLPGRISGQPVSTSPSVIYNFTMKDIAIQDYGNLEQRGKKTKEKAESGDPSSQVLYGMMLAGLRQLKGTYDRARW